METPQSFSRETTRRIRQNDFTLTTLKIGTCNVFFAMEIRGRQVGGFVPSDSADLAELGRHLANNTHLNRLELSDQYFHVLCGTIKEFIRGIKLNSSVHDLRLACCNLTEGSIGCEILSAFRHKGNLTKISLQECNLDNGGVQCLASTLQNCPNIKYISITESGLSAEQLLKPAGAARVLDQLKTLELSGNHIGRDGCEALATLLRDPKCSLITLCLGENDIDDNSAIVLANALDKNNTLRKLYLDHNTEITNIGWGAFCHVIFGEYFADGTFALPGNLSHLVEMNKGTDKKQIAMEKILRNHPYFDMKPFFEWNLGTLPFVVGWFDQAKVCHEDTASIDARKLDSIFQFARAMPMMFVKAPPKKTPLSMGQWLSAAVAILSFLLYVARDYVQG
ncbi:hypothetical protein ACHAXR_009794 [Thalassiosira sp. AJA248-18]